MYSRTQGFILAVSITLYSAVAQANWWEDSWQQAKSSTASAWDSAKTQAAEWKSTLMSSETESESGQLEDFKKLADKETYKQVWQEIKESAKHPDAANVDESGIPKE